MRPGGGGKTKKKPKKASSKLSFGIGGEAEEGDGYALGGTQSNGETQPPKRKPKGVSIQRLPMRAFGTVDDDDRPRYSEAYLAELQSSTPNAPPPPSPPTTGGAADDNGGDEDESSAMELDASELEGALVVDLPAEGGLLRTGGVGAAQTAILTETEIRERKERRSRLAGQVKAKDFIALDGSDEESDAEERTRRQLDPFAYIDSGVRLKGRDGDGEGDDDESRLVRDDEDFAEGFDAYVEDGGLALGRKAERAAKAKKRLEVAEMIAQAEGGGGGGGGGKQAGSAIAATVADHDDSSDSDEAAQRIAFEVAQSRAGMEGLAKRSGGTVSARESGATSSSAAAAIPLNITPLPELSVSLAAFRATLAEQQAKLAARRRRAEDLEEEVAGVEERKKEVQVLFDQAGQKLEALLAGQKAGQLHRQEQEQLARLGEQAAKSVTDSPMRQMENATAVGGAAAGLAMERGLESFGMASMGSMRPFRDSDEESDE